MTKAKISQYDAVAANNTDVNGVNIAENCPPSGMNNMGREIMAALKRFQTGSDSDGVTVGGNLVVSGTSTLSTTSISSADINAGTIDGTAIGGSTAAAGSFTTLNTSGQVVFNDAGADVDFRVESDTDANAFFLDGTNGNIGIGTGSPDVFGRSDQRNVGVSVVGASDNLALSLNAGSSAGRGAQIYMGVGGTRHFNIIANGNESTVGTNTSTPLRFITNDAERMRITSGGYFKASNTGSYVNSTSTHHEFVQSANDRDLWVRATDASFTSVVLQTDSTRSTSDAFSIFACTTGNNANAIFDFKGDGDAFADGTFNNNGADYAEFFESANGQALTLGATVVLDGNKVREATDQDPASSVIGVVRPKEPSKASMVIGNTAWNKWANKYLTDDFDRYIMEDHDVVEWEETITDEEGNTSTEQHSYESHAIPEGVTVPVDATRKTHDEKGNKFQHYKLNPAWNPDAEYVNRKNRPEWNIIGLLGQVKILKGQPVGDRWIKMRDVSETVEEWMIR